MSDTRPENFSSVWADLRGVSFKQHYIDAGGIRTRCIEFGDPSKPLVLALHGVGGHAEAYSRNFGPHADHFWFVAIDMLGHGWTDKPAIDYQVKDYADHVLAVLKTLGRDKAMISGESLGGWVATYLAVHRPAAVEKLVLNTAGGWTAHPQVMERLKKPVQRGRVRSFMGADQDAPRIPDVRQEHGLRRSDRDPQGDLRTAGIRRHDEADHVSAGDGDPAAQHDHRRPVSLDQGSDDGRVDLARSDRDARGRQADRRHDSGLEIRRHEPLRPLASVRRCGAVQPPPHRIPPDRQVRIVQMNQQTKHGELAARIREAYAGTPIAPIRTQLADLDVDAAYAIQQENTAHWEGRGGASSEARSD